tara:strand:+ start:432 stop:581 length:150 start_codon:yes stop_codon:yes gene_type:complete
LQCDLIIDETLKRLEIVSFKEKREIYLISKNNTIKIYLKDLKDKLWISE